jgi:peroxiredoxin
VKDHYAEFRQLGSEVLAISFATPSLVAAYLAETPMPFPVLSDPSRTSYQALGLGLTSWAAMLRPAVLAGYLRLMFRGWWPRKPNKQEDIFQLGGDFVLDAQRHVVYAHRSAEPTDRPAVAELLEAVRLAGSSLNT